MTLEELKEIVKDKQIVLLSDINDLIKTGEIRFKILDFTNSELFQGTYEELIALEKEKLSTPTICGDIQPISEETAQIALSNIEAANANLRNSLCETETAFTCDICGESQPCNYFAPIYFPVCNKCKSDLKEYVLSVRKK